jgi:hypothetical protein
MLPREAVALLFELIGSVTSVGVHTPEDNVSTNGWRLPPESV